MSFVAEKPPVRIYAVALFSELNVGGSGKHLYHTNARNLFGRNMAGRWYSIYKASPGLDQ